MPINPNSAFKDREFKGASDMMITLEQKHALTGFAMRQGIKWRDICIAVLKKHKNMSDCTFYDAARCLVAAKVWKNREGAGLK